jgi:hypothetical protein
LEVIFASQAEQILARELRTVLSSTPIGGDLYQSPDFGKVLSSLEYYIPEMLREVHPEWQYESLDGVYPGIARRTGEREAEIDGLCILITDQTLTLIHVRLGIAADYDEIVWLDCELGELGPGGMVRMPYNRRPLLSILDASVRLDIFEWVYHVGFRERGVSGQVPP